MSQLPLDWASPGCVLVILFLLCPEVSICSHLWFCESELYLMFVLSHWYFCELPSSILDLAGHFKSSFFFQYLQWHFLVDLIFQLNWNKMHSDAHIVITAFLSPAFTKHGGGLHLWLCIIFTRGVLKMTLVPFPHQILIYMLWVGGPSFSIF